MDADEEVGAGRPWYEIEGTVVRIRMRVCPPIDPPVLRESPHFLPACATGMTDFQRELAKFFFQKGHMCNSQAQQGWLAVNGRMGTWARVAASTFRHASPLHGCQGLGER